MVALAMSMYKSKYCKEPYLSKMKKAIEEIRLKGRPSSVVCNEMEIPARTMRRYIQNSKNPENKLFYIEEKEEPEPGVMSWKPESCVPMFTIADFQKSQQNLPSKPLSTLNIEEYHSKSSVINPHCINLDNMWQEIWEV